MEIDLNRLKNWLTHFKLPLLQSHASGHCSREELKEVIEQIKPKAVYPVHTENPLAFKEIAENVEVKGGGEEILPLDEAVVLVKEAEEERAKADEKLRNVLEQLGFE